MIRPFTVQARRGDSVVRADHFADETIAVAAARDWVDERTFATITHRPASGMFRLRHLVQSECEISDTGWRGWFVDGRLVAGADVELLAVAS